eukprot:EG_transcript_13851
MSPAASPSAHTSIGVGRLLLLAVLFVGCGVLLCGGAVDPSTTLHSRPAHPVRRSPSSVSRWTGALPPQLARASSSLPTAPDNSKSLPTSSLSPHGGAAEAHSPGFLWAGVGSALLSLPLLLAPLARRRAASPLHMLCLAEDPGFGGRDPGPMDGESQLSRRAVGGLYLLLGVASRGGAQETSSAPLQTASGPTQSWSFEYPADWETARKPLKTHFEELEVNSPTLKKCSVGLAVDPIKLPSLEAFGDPAFVGERVVGVEKTRDGVLSAQLLGATNEPRDGLAYYELEYAVAGSRGEYHHLARVAVAKGYLFVLTAKVKEATWSEAEPIVRQILRSFRVQA